MSNISDLPRAQANEMLRQRAAAHRESFERNRAARRRVIEQRLAVATLIIGSLGLMWLLGWHWAWIVPGILVTSEPVREAILEDANLRRTLLRRLTIASTIIAAVAIVWIVGRGFAWLIPLILSPEASTAPAPPAVSIPVGAFEARAGQPHGLL